MALQTLALALSLTRAGVFSEGCEVYRVMMKGLTERHPQALKPAHWHVVMETCTPEHMCANTRVYATCVHTDTVTASRTLTAIHTEAVQLHHWSPGNHMVLQSRSETDSGSVVGLRLHGSRSPWWLPWDAWHHLKALHTHTVHANHETKSVHCRCSTPHLHAFNLFPIHTHLNDPTHKYTSPPFPHTHSLWPPHPPSDHCFCMLCFIFNACWTPSVRSWLSRTPGMWLAHFGSLLVSNLVVSFGDGERRACSSH